MAGSERIGALRYDIIADDSDFQRSMKGSFRMTKNLKTAMEKTKTPFQRFTEGARQAARALDKGRINFKAYNYEMDRLQTELNQGSVALNRNTKAQLTNNAAKKAGSRVNRGTLFGSVIAGSGLGGAGSAMGRVAGIGTGMGGASAGLMAGGMAAMFTAVKSMKEYSKVESSTAELQVYLGTKEGIDASDRFREIAKNSSLTTSQLVKNAAVLKSYGNDFENLTDFTKRLGQASGGDTVQFANLTKAFAQINAMGKLMGQEKNQLVNAGYSLKLIAKEAGVEMVDFGKAMEAGLITAEHVNQSLINSTNEGGLYGDRLERRGNTLAGKFDIMQNNWNEMFAMLGESQQGIVKGFVDGLSDFSKRQQESLGVSNKIAGLNDDTNRILNLIEGNTRGDKKSELEKRQALQGNAAGIQNNAQFYSWWDTLFPTWMGGTGDVGFDAGGFEALNGSGGGGFWDRWTSDPEQRRLLGQQALQQAQFRNGTARSDAESKGIKIDEEAKPGDKPVEVTPVSKSGSTKASTLDNGFGAGSMDEYNFIRDRLMDDRSMAAKSLSALEQIARNTSAEETAAEEGRKGWRRRAQAGLDLKKANREQLGEWAFAAGNWLGNGGRTDAQVRADQSFNDMGDPTGGTYAQERRARSGDIYAKYAGDDNLLDDRFSPDGSRAGGGIKSELKLYKDEVKEMTAALKLEFKHKKNVAERKEELKAIKEGVDSSNGIKGILGDMYTHMTQARNQIEGI